MKFVIFCPDHEGGGPTALLQLNHALMELGIGSEVLFYDKAEFAYEPATGNYAVRYVKPIGLKLGFTSYQICHGFDRDAVLVFPEVQLGLAKKFHAVGHRRKIFWWLSWNNGPLREINAFDNALVLMSCLHMFQSEYARRNASRFGYTGPIVSDWTIAPDQPYDQRKQPKTNDACFLPAKAPGTEALIGALSRQFSIIPIRRMPHAEVHAVLGRSMVFLDFGPQPGKDRMPREAVLQDCVPVVRNAGSALHEEDCAIPPELRLETGEMANVQVLGDMIHRIRSNYPSVLASLQPVKASVRMERARFTDEVRRLLDLIAKDSPAAAWPPRLSGGRG